MPEAYHHEEEECQMIDSCSRNESGGGSKNILYGICVVGRNETRGK